MLHFLWMGILLGLSAGLAPGPLLTLVITETLQHDMKAGIKVALAPIITDVPIILMSGFILSGLSHYRSILGYISLTGGMFILFMGFESMRTRGIETGSSAMSSRSLVKGVLANALNPHPYLFWLSVGAPTLIKAMDQDIRSPLSFLMGFYLCLVGSKMLLAILFSRSKTFLTGGIYIYIMRGLGLQLIVLALSLFIDGWQLLGVKTNRLDAIFS